MADDTINALTQQSNQSSLLGMLAHPAVVNPLAAISGAVSTAGGIYDLKQKQANIAWGNALQQATDENGNVDYPKAQAIAARDPMATAGMQDALRNNAQLQTSQINNVAGHMKLVGQSAMTVQKDPSDANVNAAFDNLIANGSPKAQVESERSRWLAMSPAERQENAYRTGLASLDQMHQVIGQTTGVNTGGQIQPLTVTQPGVRSPGGIVQGPGAVTTTLSPESQAQYQQWLQQEVEIPDPSNPGGTQKSTRLQMFQRMGVDPKLFYPAGSGGTSAAPPAVPAAPAVPATPAQPAVSTAGAPLRQPSGADIATQKAGAEMGIGLTQRAGQVPDNQANLGNMLTDANKLDSMGSGSAREAYLNSFFQKWSGSGLLGNSTREQIAAAESFNKIGNIMAASQMAALGASDARQQLAIGANPHLDLSKLGNEQIIHMLQGNEDAIAAKSGAWEDWKLTHGTGSYAQFQNDLNKNFDLRAFQQRYMSQPEIDAMKAQMKSQGTDKEFIRKVLYARQQGWIPQ